MFYIIAMGVPPQGANGQSNIFAAMMPLVAFFFIIYFLLLKPQKQKQKEVQKMLSEIQKGDKVITSSGIHGIVAGVKDDIVSVKVADDVKIDFSRSCIASVKKEKTENA